MPYFLVNGSVRDACRSAPCAPNMATLPSFLAAATILSQSACPATAGWLAVPAGALVDAPEVGGVAAPPPQADRHKTPIATKLNKPVFLIHPLSRAFLALQSTSTPPSARFAYNQPNLGAAAPEARLEMASIAPPAAVQTLNLHGFLEDYERDHPEEVIHVEQPIDVNGCELTALITKLEKAKQFPVLIFHNALVDG